MRVLIGMLGQESNAFAKEHFDFARFAPNGVVQPDELVEKNRGGNDYLSGMIELAEREGVDLLPLVGNLTAGAMLTRDCLNEMTELLLSLIAQSIDQADGLCLAVHGAGRAEGVDGIEAYMLGKIRDLTGPDFPITITLDLHANLTTEMLGLANGAFGIKEYPHTDKAAAGRLAMEALIAQIRGEYTPLSALVRLPLLIAPINSSTLAQPMQGVRDFVKACARRHGLLDATFFHGFPYADVPACTASVLAVSRGDMEAARRAALEIAEFVWRKRADFVPESLSAEQAVDRAMAVQGSGYVVINESSDNPGGGTPGDGTHLLRALLLRNAEKTVFCSILDPEIAALAHAAGVGGRVSGLLGAKKDSLHGEPIALQDALVCTLSDGHYICNSPVQLGMHIDMGKTARLRVGQVDFIVTSVLARQTYCDAPFIMAGADLSHYRLVALKSSNHFKAFFQGRALSLVTADPPGIQTANFAALPFSKLVRPVFPLDADTRFDPAQGLALIP